MSWEDRFNKNFHYDWVFLNNEPFSEEFIRLTSRLVSGKAQYGVISEENFSVPKWINLEDFEKSKLAMQERNVPYSMNTQYRHMCRFNSGLFVHHPLMQQYKYYWRVDGDTHMFCDVDVDVFKYMRANNLKYAFTLSMYEYMDSIPNLWDATLKFLQRFPQYVAKDNLASFVSDDSGKTYNGCHFWTNFELGDADFFRSEKFTRYFNFLDHVGGFYYERWGDAPVHSLAASLMLSKDEVAHLDWIGYYHSPLTHMPSDYIHRNLRCAVNPERNFMWRDRFNCVRKFYGALGWDDLVHG